MKFIVLCHKAKKIRKEGKDKERIKKFKKEDCEKEEGGKRKEMMIKGKR